MLVNNELGTIYHEIIKQLRELLPPEIPIHCDAIQALGKLRFSVKDLGVNFLSLSGHKIHAPKGVGVLYIKNGQTISQLIWGHQERQQRGGTENAASIIGFGQAAEDIYATSDDGETFENRLIKISRMRDNIEASVLEIEGAFFNGQSSLRVANTTNIGFLDIDAIKLSLLLEQRGIFISNGAACNKTDPQHSHVLKAINSPTYENGAIRISLSSENTEYDIEYFIENLKYCIVKLRGGNQYVSVG
jgi:cysteine desulfurase